MAIPVNTPTEIDALREGGRLLTSVLTGLRRQVVAGISELELDKWTAKEIKALGAEATYRTKEVNFPGVVCISVNDEIVHGVPSTRRLERGDLVSFDLVITYKGMKTDSAFTMVVEESPSGAVKHLLSVTEKSLFAGINAVKSGGDTTVGDISAAVQKVLEAGRLGIIRDLVGHGVGRLMHQDPEIPNWGKAGRGLKLPIGCTIAIEPMATLGGERIITGPDGWTIASADGSLSAHFEHTVLVTQDGAEILTQA